MTTPATPTPLPPIVFGTDGWRARIGLREGVEGTYTSFLAEKAAGTLRV